MKKLYEVDIDKVQDFIKFIDDRSMLIHLIIARAYLDNVSMYFTKDELIEYLKTKFDENKAKDMVQELFTFDCIKEVAEE